LCNPFGQHVLLVKRSSTAAEEARHGPILPVWTGASNETPMRILWSEQTARISG
jgi:hypothetical protein